MGIGIVTSITLEYDNIIKSILNILVNIIKLVVISLFGVLIGRAS